MIENEQIISSSYKQVSIFIIDDDDIDVQSFKRVFTKLKIANPIYRAKDGIEALDMLKMKKVPGPYIILLDINMPRMNGLEFLKELREDRELTVTVVFVLTTSVADEDIFEAYRLHVAGYIPKHEMDKQFLTVVSFLDHYWRVVELPHSG